MPAEVRVAVAGAGFWAGYQTAAWRGRLSGQGFGGGGWRSPAATTRWVVCRRNRA